MIYHVEWSEPTSDGGLREASLSTASEWTAARMAALQAGRPGVAVSIFGQSHDAAGMFLVPESEWREWL